VLLLVTCGVLFCLGLFFASAIDATTKRRFCRISRQDGASGNWSNSISQRAAYHKKPVGLTGLQAGVVTTRQSLGMEDAESLIGLYRLPFFCWARFFIRVLTALLAQSCLARGRDFIAGIS